MGVQVPSLRMPRSTDSEEKAPAVSVENTENNAMEEVKKLAADETKRMKFWKYFVLVRIFLTGVAVCLSVYAFRSNQQQDELENKVS